MIFIGVDPGKSGAMAFIYKDDNIVTVSAIAYDKDAYLEAIKKMTNSGLPIKCCIERVNAMPGQGVTSMFNFGLNYGWLLGILEANEIPYETVLPKKWKAEFGLTGDKANSIEVCKRMFPKVSLLRNECCKKDDDGKAEALLMAEYARRKM